jgi:hypothetical protein
MSAFILSVTRIDPTRLDSKETSVPPQHVGVRRIRPIPRKREALVWGPVWGGTRHSGIAPSGRPSRGHWRTGPPGDRGQGGRPPGGRDPNGRPDGERRSGPAGGAGNRCSSTCWWPPSPRSSPRPSRVAEHYWRFLRSWACCCPRWSFTRKSDLPDRGSATRTSWALGRWAAPWRLRLAPAGRVGMLVPTRLPC